MFEYIKAIFKQPEVKSVVIYSTMPDGLIVGEFEIGEILAKHPEDLWEQTKDFAGIDKQFFDDYFLEREVAYAIEIKNLNKYSTPFNPYKRWRGFKAPQSFMYI